MPSSLIVVGLVVAWLVVLVPMVVRKRQEVARTTDTALAARVVRSGAQPREEAAVEPDASFDPEPEYDDPEYDEVDTPRYRPGRGGYDPDAAARSARAKYAFRQRVVVLMLLAAIGTGVAAGLVIPLLWWACALVGATLVGYLTYLRRQVRIEQDIRERRAARATAVRRSHARPTEAPVADHVPPTRLHPTATIVSLDDEDPWFDDLDEPTATYRRAAGE
ncbi:gephyrin-like molybdotransferase receptor GlpR [Actinokineospora inagensis]|uniref:divisome protein SepX/GlpR n=1 Tax=Actinokineospora inagensis TaxID=103730 RepID=UPI0004140297|nr:gephyrin-like molybdotransferase receptor GlpR [Actinokineospora inagensis]